jgi:hypothetical protein
LYFFVVIPTYYTPDNPYGDPSNIATTTFSFGQATDGETGHSVNVLTLTGPGASSADGLTVPLDAAAAATVTTMPAVTVTTAPAVTVSTASAVTVSVPSASDVYYVYRTCSTPGGCGLWLRTEPESDAAHLGVMHDGDVFTVGCWQTGPSVYGDPVWLQGTWEGVSGWAMGYYIDTHGQTAADVTVQGVHECGTQPSSPLAVKTLTVNASYYFSSADAHSQPDPNFVAGRGVNWPGGTQTKGLCWASGGTVKATYSGQDSNVWVQTTLSPPWLNVLYFQPGATNDLPVC